MNFLLQNSHRFCLLDEAGGVVVAVVAVVVAVTVAPVAVVVVVDCVIVEVCSYEKRNLYLILIPYTVKTDVRISSIELLYKRVS